MKTNQFYTILVTLACFVFASKSFGQTTQYEYNYISKTYNLKFESLLVMKKGYSVNDSDKSELKRIIHYMPAVANQGPDYRSGIASIETWRQALPVQRMAKYSLLYEW